MNPIYFLRRHSWAGIFMSKPDETSGTGDTPPKADQPKNLKDALAALEVARGQISAKDEEIAAAEKKVTEAEAKVEKAEKAAADALAAGKDVRAELDQAKTALNSVTGERDVAQKDLTEEKKNVSRLEALCGVKGVDPSKAVAQTPEEGVSKDAKMEALMTKINASTDPKEKFRLSEELTALRGW
jgi:predicted  nucleic acid-binding Zn-ribbon protein